MAVKAPDYTENGVAISPKTIRSGGKVHLTYNGLLAESGAEAVVAHIGYGTMWDEKAFISMLLEDGVFRATIEVSQAGILNICFKDNADNWDNNSSQNYSFKVSNTVKKTAKKVNA